MEPVTKFKSIHVYCCPFSGAVFTRYCSVLICVICFSQCVLVSSTYVIIEDSMYELLGLWVLCLGSLIHPRHG